MSLIKKLNNKSDELRQTFRARGWERIYEDIKRYVVPDRGRLLNGKQESRSNDYDKLDRSYVVDDTGEQANNFLVSGFMSMLTPETSPWFKLNSGDPELDKVKRVGVWLDGATDLLHRVFSSSNIYSVFQSTFMEFTSFGTGAQIIFEDEVNTILPISYTAGEYLISTNCIFNTNLIVFTGKTNGETLGTGPHGIGTGNQNCVSGCTSQQAHIRPAVTYLRSIRNHQGIIRSGIADSHIVRTIPTTA